MCAYINDVVCDTSNNITVSTGTAITCILQLALLLKYSNCGSHWSPHNGVIGLIIFLNECPTTTILQMIGEI